MGNRNKIMRCNAKQHYKMYKVGKRFVYASLSVVALGSVMLLSHTTASADSTTATVVVLARPKLTSR
ncbi:KxYKxGKxW signal peptide domain-containing protein [Secundilactobacillus similis]|uniref:KxYKxGKxW signal peptide domain-containing protein n=1 Tax=Secundilactobacillus similis TaxID=414682 RepID=UPI0006D18E69|nr:KxYKxGKxW signal peptide domain-containing protein [Secundilactobacillus similis]